MSNIYNESPSEIQVLGNNYDIKNDKRYIGTEHIVLSETQRTMNITMKVFYNNSKNENWKRIWTEGLIFENIHNSWLGKGAYIINISMQNLYILKVKYYEPYILHDSKDT